MIEKTCCVTGHRDIPEDKKEFVIAELEKEIRAAVADGYTRFISGFAEGTDLIFAALIIELKAQGHPLVLEAAIPYAGRLNSADPFFQKILSLCDRIKVLCEKSSRNCYYIRNRYMVDESSRVIAVYDGRKDGGTTYTINYANTQGRTVMVIELYDK